jgi:hypothetical protein
VQLSFPLLARNIYAHMGDSWGKKVMLLSKFVDAIFRLVGLFYFTVFPLKFDTIPHYLLVVTMSS